MSDSTFSLSEFHNIQKAEAKLQEFLRQKANKPEEMKKVSGRTIDNILAYSKALSIRKSKQLDFIENLLN